MSTIGEVTITNSIRRWENEVKHWTRGVAVYREQLQGLAQELAQAAVMGDPVSPVAREVDAYVRCVVRAERTLQSAEERLAFYRDRLVLERG